ncbi:MAG TPA: TIR domain-containing protein [Methylovirgula sp.]
MADRMYDLFLTHAWRYHDDWTRASELFDQYLGDSWRNFSVPWYDPGLDPNTEVGGRLVHRWLEQQIVPVCGVVLLSSVYETNSARNWVTLEIELARKHNKRIVGLPRFGTDAMAPEAAALVDVQCSWDAKQVIEALDAAPAV